jgi:hypothetical protein
MKFELAFAELGRKPNRIERRSWSAGKQERGHIPRVGSDFRSSAPFILNWGGPVCRPALFRFRQPIVPESMERNTMKTYRGGESVRAIDPTRSIFHRGETYHSFSPTRKINPEN